MSARSEQRSGEEDWRAGASERVSEPRGRFPFLFALVVLLAVIGFVAWWVAR